MVSSHYLLGAAKFFDGDPAIGTADTGGNCDKNDVQQGVVAGAFDAGIDDIGKIRGNGKIAQYGHDRLLPQ